MIYNTPKDYDFSPFPDRNNAKKRKTAPTAARAPREPKAPERHSKRLQITGFFAVLYAGAVLALIIPLRPTYSDIEKRDLKKFPAVSAEALRSGSFFDDMSTWFSDTFPFRENLTKLETNLKSFYGFSSVAIHGDIGAGDEIPDAPLEVTTEPDTTEITAEESTAPVTRPPEQTTLPQTEKTDSTSSQTVNVQTLDGILVSGNSGYEYYNFSKTLAPEFINLVSKIGNVCKGEANVYALIAPTGIDVVLDDSIRKDVNTSDQKKALDYFNSSFKGVKAVTGVYETLREHNSEYIYFRTDHHWTALGAYYAYTQFAAAKGVNPVALSKYDTVTYKGFLGSFYSNTLSSDLKKKPDSIKAYLPVNNVSFAFTQTDGQTMSWPVINDVTEYNAGSKYCTFIAGDQPYEKIVNKDITDGDSCLVIKESYGNAFVPFLIPHYKTIHVIDPRHYKGTLSEFLKSHPVDDVIFVANISTTRNNIYIDAMSNLIK